MSITLTKKFSLLQLIKHLFKQICLFWEILWSRRKFSSKECSNSIWIRKNRTLLWLKLMQASTYRTQLIYMNKKILLVKIWILQEFSTVSKMITFLIRILIASSKTKNALKFLQITRFLSHKPTKNTTKSIKKPAQNKIRLFELTKEIEPLKMIWLKLQVKIFLINRL